MNRGRIAGAVCTICGIALLGLGLMFYQPYQKNKDTINELKRTVITDYVPNFGTPVEQQEETYLEDTAPQSSSVWKNIDFDLLKTVNTDIIGWITIPDTHIDYPVLQGDTLEQYLNRGYDGQYNALGSIFTYPNTDLENDRHMILFGHRTFDHQMFGDLNNFSDYNYAQGHNVYLYTENGCQVYHAVASYLCSPQDITLSEMTNTENYYKAVYQAANNGGWMSDVAWRDTDAILTLVTCPPQDSEHYRRVVQCIRSETYGDAK